MLCSVFFNKRCTLLGMRRPSVPSGAVGVLTHRHSSGFFFGSDSLGVQGLQMKTPTESSKPIGLECLLKTSAPGEPLPGPQNLVKTS